MVKHADLLKRVSDALVKAATTQDCSGFDALRQEIDVALATSGDDELLRELIASIDMMQAVTSNPEYAPQAFEDHTPNPEIFDAIEAQDIGEIQVHLKNWDINQTFGELDCTALYHAMSCMFGISIDVINLLLDKGADPRIGLGTSSNVLHGLGFAGTQAVDPADLAKVVRRCVALGADLEQRSNKLQWTPLITAASEWNPVACEALLMAGADINAKAGDVAGVSFAGEGVLSFASGHEETRAVIKRYAMPN